MLCIFYCPQKSPESQYFKQMYPVFNCSLQPYIFFQPFQKFDENDSRNARFVVNPRQTNPRWSINLIKEVPPKAVNTRIVACDGGPGALGHPRVYINLVSYFIVVWQCISFLILSKVTYCCPQLSPVNFLGPARNSRLHLLWAPVLQGGQPLTQLWIVMGEVAMHHYMLFFPLPLQRANFFLLPLQDCK